MKTISHTKLGNKIVARFEYDGFIFEVVGDDLYEVNRLSWYMVR